MESQPPTGDDSETSTETGDEPDDYFAGYSEGDIVELGTRSYDASGQFRIEAFTTDVVDYYDGDPAEYPAVILTGTSRGTRLLARRKSGMVFTISDGTHNDYLGRLHAVIPVQSNAAADGGTAAEDTPTDENGDSSDADVDVDVDADDLDWSHLDALRARENVAGTPVNVRSVETSQRVGEPGVKVTVRVTVSPPDDKSAPRADVVFRDNGSGIVSLTKIPEDLYGSPSAAVVAALIAAAEEFLDRNAGRGALAPVEGVAGFANTLRDARGEVDEYREIERRQSE